MIVFLGTPHRGSYAAGWGVIAANMASLFFKDANIDLLRGLDENSEVLDMIHNSFVDTVMEKGIQIYSFQEGRGLSAKKGLHDKVRSTGSTYSSEYKLLTFFRSLKTSLRSLDCHLMLRKLRLWMPITWKWSGALIGKIRSTDLFLVSYDSF